MLAIHLAPNQVRTITVETPRASIITMSKSGYSEWTASESKENPMGTFAFAKESVTFSRDGNEMTLDLRDFIEGGINADLETVDQVNIDGQNIPIQTVDDGFDFVFVPVDGTDAPETRMKVRWSNR